MFFAIFILLSSFFIFRLDYMYHFLVVILAILTSTNIKYTFIEKNISDTMPTLQIFVITTFSVLFLIRYENILLIMSLLLGILILSLCHIFIHKKSSLNTVMVSSAVIFLILPTPLHDYSILIDESNYHNSNNTVAGNIITEKEVNLGLYIGESVDEKYIFSSSTVLTYHTALYADRFSVQSMFLLSNDYVRDSLTLNFSWDPLTNTSDPKLFYDRPDLLGIFPEAYLSMYSKVLTNGTENQRSRVINFFDVETYVFTIEDYKSDEYSISTYKNTSYVLYRDDFSVLVHLNN